MVLSGDSTWAATTTHAIFPVLEIFYPLLEKSPQDMGGMFYPKISDS